MIRRRTIVERSVVAISGRRPGVSQIGRHSIRHALAAVAVVWTVATWLTGGLLPIGQSEYVLALGVFAVDENGTEMEHIPQAIAAAEAEQTDLILERDAFRQFATAVQSIPVSTGETGAAAPVPVSEPNPAGTQLRDVQAAYRDTVMAVDHFDREYGESLSENMAVELSEGVTTAVIDGYQFTQPLKQAIIQQSIASGSRRESLLETLRAELELLEQSERRIRDIASQLETRPPPLTDRSLTDLFDRERQLCRCEARCERLLSDRQQQIHSDTALEWNPHTTFVQSYLYDRLEVDFPVLATATNGIAEIHELMQATRREITYR